MPAESNKYIGLLFPNLKGNIGDFAILEAIMRDLEKSFPDHGVKLFPHDHLPTDKVRVSKFEAASGYELEVSIPVESPRLPRGIGVLKRIGAWPQLQKLVVQHLSLRQKSLTKELLKCDFICFAGGDHWNGARLGPAMFGALCLAESLNKKVYCYPFSCNPAALNFNTSQSLKKYFNIPEKPLIVRDSTSYQVISDLGVETTFGSDCVYGLKNIIKDNRYQRATNNTKISICVTSAKGVSTEESTASIVKNLEKKFGRSEIEVISTCEIEDAPTLNKCSALSGIQKHYPATWQEAVEQFCSSSIVITNRLHALILCSMCEVPVLPITNREKSKAFAIDVGLSASCLDASHFSADSVEECLKEAEEIRQKLRSFAIAGFDNVHSPF